MPAPRIITLLSGGIDSMVLCDLLLKERRGVQVAVFVDYGHKAAKREWMAVRAFTRGRIQVSKVSLRIRGAFPRSQLVTGRLEDKPFLPGRNLLLLMVAAWKACELKAKIVAIGLRDVATFLDTSHVFVERFSGMSYLSFGMKLSVVAPLMHMDKAHVVRLGEQLGTKLARSYSCYLGRTKPCGRCGGCKDREGLIA